MNKEDLLLTDYEIAEYPLPDHKHTLRDMKRNVTNAASLKTAKAIRDEFRTVYKHGDIKTFRLIFDNLDSIIKELEAKS